MTNLRDQFPIFQNFEKSPKPIYYLDSAATAQKPKPVIDVINSLHTQFYASSHSIHSLGQNITQSIENCRLSVQKLINSPTIEQIIFGFGATDSLNLVANCFLQSSLESKNKTQENSIFNLKPGDEILVSIAEHHANLLPWQRVAKFTGAKIIYFDLDSNHNLDYSDYFSKLSSKTKIVVLSHCSNVIGVINPIYKFIQKSKQYNAITVVDGTQAVVHTRVDVQALGCDFYCFSGHKIYGPTGTSCLWTNQDLLEKIPNYRMGGDMVEIVEKDFVAYKKPPHRLEAGTDNLAGIIGLGVAIDWFIANRSEIFDREEQLKKYFLDSFSKCGLKGVKIIGNNIDSKVCIFTLVFEYLNAFDIAIFLDTKGVCVRSGQHCTGLLHEYIDYTSSLRVSLACYNTESEIDYFFDSLKQCMLLLKNAL